MAAPPKKATAQEAKSRERILEAAEQLFSSRGFAATSTRLIAKQANVNIALLYYYFDSKEGLYRALVERYSSHFAKVLETLLVHDGDTKTRIEYAIDALFEYLAKNSRFVRILVRESLAGQMSEHVKAAHAYLRAIFAAGEAVITNGIQTKAIHPVDPQLFLAHVYGAIVYYFSAASNLKLLLGADPTSDETASRAKEEIKMMVLSRLGLNAPRPSA